MAGVPQGWRLRFNRGIGHVRFTFAGKRFSISTGERARGAAREAAERIYAETVSRGGRRSLKTGAPASTRKLAEVVDEWIAALEATHTARTAHEYHLVADKWIERWSTLGHVTVASIADYQRDRLREVVKETARKNSVSLRTFLAWCVEQGVIAEAPLVPVLPKRATGTRKIQRTPRPALTPAQVNKVIAKLPVWSSGERRNEGQRYRVRDRARFAFETALRPATIARLSVPEHWKPGSKTLTITADVDKARWAREVALTNKAITTLTRSAKGDGLIFGEHEMEDYLAAAGDEAIKRRVLPYDLKHARITELFRAGADPVGISQLTGVALDTLVKHYVHPGAEASRKALRRVA